MQRQCRHNVRSRERRFRLIQAKVPSTIHRFGKTSRVISWISYHYFGRLPILPCFIGLNEAADAAVKEQSSPPV